MRIELLWVGKPRGRLLDELADRYLTRLRRFTAVEVSWVPEGRARRPADVRRAEAKHLQAGIGRLGAGRRSVVALDERGAQASTRELADMLQTEARAGVQHVSFILGGAEGLDPGMLARADRTLALSRLTLSHEWARALLAEQLYRCHALLAGHPYHRD